LKPTQKKLFSIAVIFVILMSYFLVSCNLEPIKVDIPTPTLSPTPRICPTLNADAQKPIHLSPTLIVMFIDTDYHYMDYSDDALQSILDIIPFAVEPGDKLYIYKLGVKDFDDAMVLNITSDGFEYPAIPPTPTLYPTLSIGTPLPTRTDIPLLSLKATQIRITQTVESLHATATQSSFENICAQKTWSDSYKATATEWQKTRQASINEFSENLLEELDPDASKLSEGTTTPIPTMIYESLAQASLIFSNECSEYGKCKLILFSDMQDWRDTTPENLSISLKKVDTMAVMMNCSIIFNPECTKIQNLWKTNFDTYESNITFVNGDRLNDNLIQFIRR
jgi:hypothetical protein